MRLPADFDGRRKKGGDYDSGCMLSSSTVGDDCCKKKHFDDDDEEEEDYPIPRHPTPPDGGRSWIVALASFFNLMIADGLGFCFGVLSFELMRDFDTTHDKISWAGSCLTGCSFLVGPFVAVLCGRYGCRKVTIAGSILTMFGLLLSAQSHTVPMLITTYGVIGGIGLGMILFPSAIIVIEWFDRKRALATGFAWVGSGAGQFIFPQVASHLLDMYSWQNSMYILAGIVLNCCVAAMFFTPVAEWRPTSSDWFGQGPRRPAHNHKVEIVRGDIMKALIESKKRERTTSNGSLDGCVITRDNQLIKLDPLLIDAKRNNSLIARFRRQLGFSSQSLASSKSSLKSGIPSIVIDAVNKDLKDRKAAARAAGSNSLTSSPIYRPGGVSRGSLPSNSGLGSSPLAALPSTRIPGVPASAKDAHSGDAPTGGIPGFPKTRSCDVIVAPATSAESVGHDSSFGSAAGVSGGGTTPPGLTSTRSASELQACIPGRALELAGLEGMHIQSIQIIPNSLHGRNAAATRAKGLRNRSSRSESSTYSFGGFSYADGDMSAAGSTVLASSHGSFNTQMHASLEEVQLEDSSVGSKKSLSTKFVHVLLSMLDLRLFLNPSFLLFIVSTTATLLGFYIPYFYLPVKGIQVGLTVANADFLISVIGITNTVGRIACGWLSDRPWVNTLWLYGLSLVVAGTSMLFSPYCESRASLMLLASVLGFTFSVTVSLRTILLIKFLGVSKLAQSYGIVCLFQGVASLGGPPFAGKLLDMTGNADNCFYMAGFFIILSGLVIFPIYCLPKPGAEGQGSDPESCKSDEAVPHPLGAVGKSVC